MPAHWIQNAIKKPGALRKALKIKEGKDIPLNVLYKATKQSGVTGKRARLAKTLRSFQ